MTTPRNRDELREMLARRMMAYDQCSEDKLAVVYEGLAEDVLSALDAAGLVIVPADANHVMVRAFADAYRDAPEGYGVSGAFDVAWDALLSASPFEKDRER